MPSWNVMERRSLGWNETYGTANEAFAEGSKVGAEFVVLKEDSVIKTGSLGLPPYCRIQQAEHYTRAGVLYQCKAALEAKNDLQANRENLIIPTACLGEGAFQ